MEATEPAVVEAVLSDNATPEQKEALAPSGSLEVQPPPVAPDNLTIIEGIGPKMSAALVAAGIDSFTKLSMASEEEIRNAIQAAGLRFAPSLPTWKEQATFLARGDMQGFEAMRTRLASGRRPTDEG
jgi:predicted flap endonuclease-1-like 5' DNA nuclease